MATTAWTDADTNKAMEIWDAYRKSHDLSESSGQVAGIDIVSGQVWLGASAKDIVESRQRQGLDGPLFFIRVGFNYHVRKGGCR